MVFSRRKFGRSLTGVKGYGHNNGVLLAKIYPSLKPVLHNKKRTKIQLS